MSAREHRIILSETMERRLSERAAAAGTDAESYIVRAVEEKLSEPKSFRELFAPLQQAFSESRETDEALEHAFAELRDLVHRRRLPKAS